MPGLLGKRKSRQPGEGPDPALDAQEILRRHFEARFKPIDAAARAAQPNKSEKPKKSAPNHASNGSQDDDDSEAGAGQSDSEWDGVSDGGEEDIEDEADTPVVEVVDHTSTASANTAQMSKRELKAYLVCLPHLRPLAPSGRFHPRRC